MMRLSRATVLLMTLFLFFGCSVFQKHPDSKPSTVDMDGENRSGQGDGLYGPPMDAQSTEDPPENENAAIIPQRPPVVALVLGPGGTRGFAHLGVIKKLEEAGIQPAIVTGSGFGALVGGLYSYTGNANRLEWELFKMREENYFDPPLFGKVAKGKAVFRYLNRVFKKAAIQKHQLKFGTSAIQRRSGKIFEFKKGHSATLIRASLAVPGWMEPIRFAQRKWTSGATQSPLPVELAKALGAEIIIAVDLLEDVAAVSGVLEETSEVFKNLLASMSALSSRQGEEASMVIRPDLTGFAMMDFNRRADAIYRGKQATEIALDELKKIILDWKPPPEEWMGPLPSPEESKEESLTDTQQTKEKTTL